MKTAIFCACLIFFPFLQLKQNKKTVQKKDDIDSIIVYKLSPYSNYPVYVECQRIKTHPHVIKFSLLQFKNRILHDMSIRDSFPGSNQFDVKSRVEIWYKSGKVDILCLGPLPGMSINDKMFELGPDLNNLLDSLYDDWEDKQPNK